MLNSVTIALAKAMTTRVKATYLRPLQNKKRTKSKFVRIFLSPIPTTANG